MSDASPEPEPDDPFSSSSSFPDDTDAPPWDAPGDDLSGPPPPGNDQSASMALDMARLWVQQHQKASMLGAFAVGTFIGALLRRS